MQQDPYAGIARRDDERDPYEGIARRDDVEQSGASSAGAARRARVDAMAMQQFGKPYASLSRHERMMMRAETSLAAQGTTFGFWDEAMAGVDALAQGAGNLVRSATGQPIERTMGEEYERRHDIYNTELERRREGAPIASAATEFTGSLAVGPARAVSAGINGLRQVGQAVVPALTRGQAFAQGARNVGKGALIGGAGGATYGAGSAERGERTEDIVQNAAVGATVGGAVPFVTSVGGSAVRGLRQPRGEQTIMQAAKRAGLDSDLPERLANAGPDQFVAEAVGGRARRIAQGVPGLSEDAADIAATAIGERQSRNFERLISGVRNVASNDGTRAATQRVADLRAAARPLFNQVDENVIQATPAIREGVRALRRGGVSFRRADRLAGAAGNGRVRLSALADDADIPDNVRLGDLRALISQAEDDAGRAFSSGQGGLGRALSDQARALRMALKEADPNFREASRLWHSAAQDERAIELGRGVFSGRAGAADELSDFMEGGMSASERQGFLEGVTQAIEARASRAAENGGNAASRFNARYIRDRLRMVFGDDADQITGLLDDLNGQASFDAMTLRSANSATAGRREATEAARSAMRTGAAGAIRDVRGTVSLSGPRNALADVIEGSPDEASAAMARLLFRPANVNDAEMQKLVQAYTNRRGLFGRSAPSVLPAYAGAAAVNASN